MPDPTPEADDAAARAAYVLRSHVLERIGRALKAKGLDALLVKGAALAMTMYADPWERSMDDIDLIARPGTSREVIRCIERLGFVALRPRGRPLSHEAFGEVGLVARFGGVPVLVEVHTRLDKLVSRPIDYGEIFARADPASGFPGLLIPCVEDHILLVVLHAAGTEFRHAVAFRDLELLLEAEVDEGALIERAKRWRLRTATFIALSALERMGHAGIPSIDLRAIAPGRVRRTGLACFYRLGTAPVAKAPFRLGWRWVLRQTPLRDDLFAWVLGLVRYAAFRLVERAPFCSITLMRTQSAA